MLPLYTSLPSTENISDPPCTLFLCGISLEQLRDSLQRYMSRWGVDSNDPKSAPAHGIRFLSSRHWYTPLHQKNIREPTVEAILCGNEFEAVVEWASPIGVAHIHVACYLNRANNKGDVAILRLFETGVDPFEFSVTGSVDPRWKQIRTRGPDPLFFPRFFVMPLRKMLAEYVWAPS